MLFPSTKDYRAAVRQSAAQREFRRRETRFTPRGKRTASSRLRYNGGLFDPEGYMAMDALYVFSLDSKRNLSPEYLLSLMNSRLLTFIYRYFAQEEGRALAQVKAENLYPVPIRRIDFTTSETSRASFLANSKQLHQRSASDGKPDGLL